MPRVLLTDDDQALVTILRDYLCRFDHDVHTARDGTECLAAVDAVRPHVVVLDLSMPGMDGFEALQRLRARSAVPVILLTARGEEAAVLQGFALGADDYVTKPFSFAQLEARIRAVTARAGTAGDDARVLSRGELCLERDARRLLRRGERVKLTPTEFRLLETLMGQPGKIFSPQQLVQIVWGEQYASESDYVRRYIWYLRQKVEDDPERPAYILTERTVGYYFAAP